MTVKRSSQGSSQNRSSQRLSRSPLQRLQPLPDRAKRRNDGQPESNHLPPVACGRELSSTTRWMTGKNRLHTRPQVGDVGSRLSSDIRNRRLHVCECDNRSFATQGSGDRSTIQTSRLRETGQTRSRERRFTPGWNWCSRPLHVGIAMETIA